MIGSGAIAPPDRPDGVAARVASRAAEFREHGWEKLLQRFEAQEPDRIPEWMMERIRATDVEQFVDLLQSFPDWDWDEWDALPKVTTPTLFLTGELEDPDDHVAQAVARMPHGERMRFPRQGHINAFLATDAVLPHVTAFLAEQAPRPADGSTDRRSS